MVGEPVGHGHLLGRDAELRWLRRQLEDVDVNGAAVVLVCGEAGIGKTALVQHLLSAPTLMDAQAVGHCVPHDADPFGPLRPLVAAVAGVEAAGELGREIATISASVGVSAAEFNARRFTAFARTSDQLTGGLGERRGVLVIDDLHWGHAPLHDFVRFWANDLERSRLRHRILLVLVTRPLPPPHPVAALLADLERSSRVRRLDVSELDADTIRRLVVSDVGEPVSTAYFELAERGARGNPLRARAVVRALKQRRVPVNLAAADDRSWGELRVPYPLDDPVTAWIEGLRPQLQADIGRAAVLGSEFRLKDAEAVVHDTTTLQEAMQQGLIDSDGRSAWFVHGLYREVAYDILTLADRQAAHLAAAAKLSEDPDSSPASFVVIGRHLLGAGDRPAAASTTSGHLRQAGLAAISLTLWGEAARFLEAARRLGPGASAPLQQDAALLGALGRAYYFDHDFLAAAPALRTAIDIAEQHGPEEVWADTVVTWLRMITATDPQSLRRPADRQVGRAFLASARDPKFRSLVLQILAEMEIMAGEVDDSCVTATEAVTYAEASQDPTAMALAYYAQAFADMTALNVRAGTEGTRRALTQARRGGDWFTEGIMLARLSFPLVAAGELAEAEAVSIACVDHAKDHHEHSNQALGLSVAATTALLRADFRQAEELGTRAGEETRRSGYVLADLFVAPALILANACGGDLAEAERVLETWPSLPRSARDAYRAVVAALTTQDAAPPGALLRAPPRFTFVSAGYYLAAIDAAVLAGRSDLAVDALPALEDWQARGLEFPMTYPTSVTRLIGEILAGAGATDAAVERLRRAAILCERQDAQLELVRSLAGLARCAAGEQRRDAIRRLGPLVERIGLHPAILGALPHTVVRSERSIPGAEPPWRVVMITDIVDSTRISRILGDVAYLDVVLRHHALVRRLLSQWAGHEFSEAGDGLLAWFTSADDAVRCALDIHGELQRSNAEPKLRIRIALAAGAPLFHDGRPYGLVLNRAARLLDHTPAGDLSLDEGLTRGLERSQLIDRIELVDLKGIGPHHVSFLKTSDYMYHDW